jgi:GNAT superfamily N-acetyltransferase
VIRRATPADAPAIAVVQARTWRHAYADIVEPEQMPTVADQAPRWAAHLDAGGAVHVWDQDGRVAGFATAGPGREDATAGELYAIYVDPPAQGAGVGSALLAAAEQSLRDAGLGDGLLWTFEANGLARAFYERHGWEADGGRREGLAPEVRYRKRLPPTAPAPGAEPPGGGTPRA